MLIKRTSIGLLSVLVMVTLAGPASAYVFWDNPAGSAGIYDWANGGSDNGLFGSPTLVNGNTLLFEPDNFRADSSNGTPELVGDRLEVDLIAHPGETFTQLVVYEWGDYEIVGTGSVSVSGTVFATDLDQFRIRYDALASTPTTPITTGDGQWTAVAVIDLTGASPDWTHFKLVMDNNLAATSGANSSAFLDKKVMIIPTPEPATLALLVLGLPFLRRRFR